LYNRLVALTTSGQAAYKDAAAAAKGAALSGAADSRHMKCLAAWQAHPSYRFPQDLQQQAGCIHDSIALVISSTAIW
jgi:hypothetical protein